MYINSIDFMEVFAGLLVMAATLGMLSFFSVLAGAKNTPKHYVSQKEADAMWRELRFITDLGCKGNCPASWQCPVCGSVRK